MSCIAAVVRDARESEVDTGQVHTSPVTVAHGKENPLRRDMVLRSRKVILLQLPKTLRGERGEHFLREVVLSMPGIRPRIALNCADLQSLDRHAVHLLLSCLEEAMKRNGDIRLTGVSKSTKKDLERWGVANLFKIFESDEEAIRSFQLPVPETVMQSGVSGGQRQAHDHSP